jgi:hypothetical protein
VRGLAALALVVALTPAAAWAYRPFVSTDAAVADAGDVEIELGYAGFRRDGARSTIVAPTVIGNIGVARDLELVAESKLATDLSPRRHGDRARFEDSALSLKWVARDGVLQESGSRSSLAVELSALLPTIRREDRAGGELVGIASGRAAGWTYHLNAGALVLPEGADPGLVGAVWDVTAPSPLHALSVDVGIRRGITRAAANWGGTAGLTFSLPVWPPASKGGSS